MPYNLRLIKALLLCVSFLLVFALGVAPPPDVRGVMSAGGTWALVSLIVMLLTIGACWLDVERVYESHTPWMVLSTAQISYVLVLSKSGAGEVGTVILLLAGIGSCAVAVVETQQKRNNIRRLSKK